MNFDNHKYAICIDCLSVFRRTRPPGPHMDVCPDCLRRWEEYPDILGEARDSLPEGHSFAELEKRCAEIRARYRESTRTSRTATGSRTLPRAPKRQKTVIIPWPRSRR